MNAVNPINTVSVVVPVKASHSSIRRLCVSLLAQTHAPFEIILVGDPGDSTWGAIEDLTRQNKVKILEVERPAGHFGRDSNLKRRAGCEHATGQIIAVTDSDMQLPPDWIATGLALMREHHVDSVAGIILSFPHSQSRPQRILDLFTDLSQPAKTPRFPSRYILDQHNFGQRKVLPISANWMFSREVYLKSGGFDPTFCLSYEDYSLAWQMVCAGGRILCTRRLWGYHHHRRQLKALLKEYVKSGRGCATFICRYPKSPFGRRRRQQLIAVLCALVSGGISLLLWPWVMLSVAMLGYLGMALLNVVRAGRVGFLFPPISLILGSGFTYGALKGMILCGRVDHCDQHYAQMHPEV